MFGWLKQKAIDASTNVMRKDLLKFIDGLKGADDEELATAIVVATVIRLNLTEFGKIPEAALNLNLPRTDEMIIQCDGCAITLNSAIAQFQKLKQPTDAFGTMIWLHSVRALNVPEIRYLGREMWTELSRGFPHLEMAKLSVHNFTGRAFPDGFDEALYFVPIGLEPRA